MRKRWLLVIVLLIALGLTAACGADSQEAAPPAQADQVPPASESLPATEAMTVQTEAPQTQSANQMFTTQSNSEKAVEVDVTPLNLSSDGATLDFEVAFNTHSVNLDFDPAAISVLRDDKGHEYPVIAWEGSGPGGHHRSGVLRFPADPLRGKVPDNATQFIEVVIHDVAGVSERVFHWDLTQ